MNSIHGTEDTIKESYHHFVLSNSSIPQQISGESYIVAKSLTGNSSLRGRVATKTNI
jgi:hypothetical protein